MKNLYALLLTTTLMAPAIIPAFAADETTSVVRQDQTQAYARWQQ